MKLSSDKYQKLFIHIIIAFLLTLSLTRFLSVSKNQLNYKYDLAYEKPSSLTIVDTINNKEPLYSKNIADKYPYIFTCYTPLYHYLVSILPEKTDNIFYTGRLISLFSFFLISLSFFFFLKNRRNLIYPLAFISLFFIFRPIIFEGAYFKNDPLALLLSVYTLILSAKKETNLQHDITIALLCVLIFFVKQSYIAITIALTFYYFFNSGKKFLNFFIPLTTLFLLAFALSYLCWGSYFFISIFAIPKSIYDFNIFSMMVKSVAKEPVFMFVTILAITSLCDYFLLQKEKLTKSPYILFMLSSLLTLMLILGVRGGARNYYYEFYSAILIWLCYYFFNYFIRKKNFHFKTLLILIFLFFLFYLEITTAPAFTYNHLHNLEKRELQLQSYNSFMKNVAKKNPKILSLVYPDYSWLYSDELILSDTYLYSRFWNYKFLNVNNIINDVIDKKFDIIILEKDKKLKEEPNSPVDYLINAVRTIYKKQERNNFDFLIADNNILKEKQSK